MKPKRRPIAGMKKLLAVLSLLVVVGLVPACWSQRIRPPEDSVHSVRTLEITGYCNCGKCCSWERSFWRMGQPVYSAGPRAGQPKEVGVTASGQRARHGTIAVDPKVFPLGSVFKVPGYGYGRGEDTGGDIKGDRLDLWFPTHSEAQQWGRKTLKVDVWTKRK